MTTARVGAGAPFAVTSGAPEFEREFARVSAALARCEPREAVFDARAYAPAAVERVRGQWRFRVLSEYQSTTVFAQMSVQTMEANAPVDVSATVLRMAQDELRHAELCAGVVTALGDTAPLAPPAAFAPLPRHAGCSPEERALRNVIYGCCLSETVNAARFVDALDTVADPFIREATRRLLADEVLHAQFGFQYLELWRDWLAGHPDQVAGLRRFLRFAFAVLERELSGANAQFKAPSPDEAALGIPALASLPATFYQTIEHAIVPALDGFGLEATAAWASRALA